MLNQVVLVGRLTKDPQVNSTENNHKVSTINLAVQRTYKNVDGIYEADFINCQLWDAIAANTGEFCHKGDIVGVKGRLQSRSYEEDGTTKYVIEVVAEKVTFLSSKNQKE